MHGTRQLIAISLWTILLVGFHCAAHAATAMVSLGLEHAVTLRSDGTVVSWGSDQYGKLGIGRALIKTTPIEVPGLTGVKDIGSGRYHTLAIRQDGTVWTWGSNSDGQLGDGTSTDRTSPVQVPGFGNARMVCGGASYSMALKQDGSLWAWGFNGAGMLGIGTQDGGSLLPVQVAGLSSVASVACGYGHALALRQDGTVWAWGSNSQGALGLGTPSEADPYRMQPVQVPGLTNVAAVVAGFHNSAVLKQDGTVWEWGRVLQDGSARLSPAQTVGITGAVKIRASEDSIVAVKADGVTWWRWTSGSTPALQDSVGNLEGAGPTLLLKSDHTVMAFGVNDNGQLGDGTTTYRPNPIAVEGLVNIVAVGSGFSHSLALDASGKVWAWGSDSNGQLGLGANLSSSVPAETIGLGNIVQVSAGIDHSLAVDQDGNLWVWGNSNADPLGDRNNAPRSTPARLTMIGNVQAVAAGDLHSLALKRDGTVWAWGLNSCGQLGDGTYTQSSTPIQVPGLSNVVGISAGRFHNLAVKLDGSVWAWGSNDHGQLGLGTVDAEFINNQGLRPPNGLPAQIPGLSGVKSVVAVDYGQSYALKADGTVMAWGANLAGNLGDGLRIERHSPVMVTGLSDVVEIAGSAWHVLARKADGTVWGWGQNSAGELGLPPGTAQTTPALVSGVAGIGQIAAGEFISALLREDGLVYMGGINRTGQLGDGTYAQRRLPILATNTTADAPLDLIVDVVNQVPTDKLPPFWVQVTKAVDVSNIIKYDGTSINQHGRVYAIAYLSAASRLLGNTPYAMRAQAKSKAQANASPLVPAVLTRGGWKQMDPTALTEPVYSGTLDQNNNSFSLFDASLFDQSNEPGIICTGYAAAVGSSAKGLVRSVVTGNDLSLTECPPLSVGTIVQPGTPVTLTPGWNLIGNGNDASINVVTLSDSSQVNSVWTWDNSSNRWAVYVPSLGTAALSDYAAGRGYAVLGTISGGQGFWVNAKQGFTLTLPNGNPLTAATSQPRTGWNLLAIGETKTPTQYNTAQSMAITSLWAWDTAKAKWYFHAPALSVQSGAALTEYLTTKGYLDFTTSGQTLGQGVGFWVNR